MFSTEGERQGRVVNQSEISEKLNNGTSKRKWKKSCSLSVSTLLKENIPKHATRWSQGSPYLFEFVCFIWRVSVTILF